MSEVACDFIDFVMIGLASALALSASYTLRLWYGSKMDGPQPSIAGFISELFDVNHDLNQTIKIKILI